jgi:hypothetical protein
MKWTKMNNWYICIESVHVGLFLQKLDVRQCETELCIILGIVA